MGQKRDVESDDAARSVRSALGGLEALRHNRVVESRLLGLYNDELVGPLLSPNDIFSIQERLRSIISLTPAAPSALPARPDEWTYQGVVLRDPWDPAQPVGTDDEPLFSENERRAPRVQYRVHGGQITEIVKGKGTNLAWPDPARELERLLMEMLHQHAVATNTCSYLTDRLGEASGLLLPEAGACSVQPHTGALSKLKRLLSR